MLLLMKSLGLIIAALVRYVPTTYTALCVVNALHALAMGSLRASKRCTRIISTRMCSILIEATLALTSLLFHCARLFTAYIYL